MALVAPEGPVYQAGTLSGNPLAMAAGLATLRAIDADPGFYPALEQRSAELESGAREIIERRDLPCRFARVGSMWTLFFTAGDVVDWTSAGAVRSRAVRPVLPRDARARRRAGAVAVRGQLCFGRPHREDIRETVAAAAEAIES